MRKHKLSLDPCKDGTNQENTRSWWEYKEVWAVAQLVGRGWSQLLVSTYKLLMRWKGELPHGSATSLANKNISRGNNKYHRFCLHHHSQWNIIHKDQEVEITKVSSNGQESVVEQSQIWPSPGLLSTLDRRTSVCSVVLSMQGGTTDQTAEDKRQNTQP